MKNKEVVLVSTLLPQVHVGRLLRVVHSFVVCSAESRSRSIRVEVEVEEVTFWVLGTFYIHIGSLFYVLYPGVHVCTYYTKVTSKYLFCTL
jgi:hypothetical protein